MQNAQIYATKDYSMFSVIEGNRKLYPLHIANLTKSILANNLLDKNPIVVNKNMQVIDGQHRLEVARNNNLTIYYVTAEDAALEEVQMLNATSKNWTGYDYIASYAKQGKDDYKILLAVVEEYGLSASNAVHLTGAATQGGSDWRMMKRGQFKARPMKDVEMRIEAYEAIKPYVAPGAYSDRDFIRALLKVIYTYPVSELIAKLEVSNRMIERAVAEKDYLRQLEDLLNYRRQNNHIRLY